MVLKKTYYPVFSKFRYLNRFCLFKKNMKYLYTPLCRIKFYNIEHNFKINLIQITDEYTAMKYMIILII